MRHLLRLSLLLPGLVAGSAPADLPPHLTDFTLFRPASVAECDARVRSSPESLLSYSCYLKLVLTRRDLHHAALRRLEALGDGAAADPRAQLYLGIALFKDQRSPRAEGLLRTAADRLQAIGEEVGEVYARTYLELILRLVPRMDEAGIQLARAKALAEHVGDPLLRAYVQLFEGWEAFSAADFGRAETLFTQARDVLDRGPNTFNRSLAYEGLAATWVGVFRYADALRAEEERLRLVALEEGAPTARLRAAVANRAFYLADTAEISYQEVDRLIAEAMEAARREGSVQAMHEVRYLHALRLGPTPEGMAEMSQNLAEARAMGDQLRTATGLWQLGKMRFYANPSDPSGAEALVSQALELARKHGSLSRAAEALQVRAIIRWGQGRDDEALADALAALDVGEQRRDRQFEESARIGLLAADASAYYDVLTSLLSRQRVEMPLAFGVLERMRARSLLESLRATEVIERPTPELRDRVASLRRQLAGVQRRIVDPGLGLAERRAAQAELVELESQERGLRDEMGRSAGRSAVAAAPVALVDVQAALQPDQALLSYAITSIGDLQVGDFVPGPRSWLLVVTRDAVAAVPVPSRDALREQVDLFRSLLDRGDGSHIEGAVRLHRDLLGEGLGQLGPNIQHLIILPDGPLHLLPFGALRPTVAGPALAERYRLSLAPSASLWVRWRSLPQHPHAVPLLAVADPPSGGASTAGTRQSAAWLRGLHLGRLPHARLEAEAAAAALGGGSRAVLGDRATERFLKTEPLARYAALHLAAHAVIDDDEPGRSALVLAPGTGDEDGLLQPRDIAALDLDQALVVLAACRSSTGKMLRGEGSLGLTRAFFQAGARAVVATLWEIDDAASSALFAGFYSRLAEGATVEEALADAQRMRIRAGAPDAAWAGVVVLGDGALRLSGGARTRSAALWPALAAALVIGVAFAVRARRRRRRALG
jgi:CHAT domain